MTNIPDPNSIPSIKTAQTNDPQMNAAIYQPPPYSIPPGQQNHHFNSAMPVYIQSTGYPPYSLPHQVNGIMVIQRNPAYRQPSNNKAILIWSIFNTFCCIWPLGIIALIISIMTLQMQGHENEQKARNGRVAAFVINTLSTIGGIVLIIVAGILYSQGNFFWTLILYVIFFVLTSIYQDLLCEKIFISIDKISISLQREFLKSYLFKQKNNIWSNEWEKLVVFLRYLSEKMFIENSDSISMIFFLLVINRTSSVSNNYSVEINNQPKFCSNATWNSNGTIFADNSTIGQYPSDINTKNKIYVINRENNEIVIYGTNQFSGQLEKWKISSNSSELILTTIVTVVSILSSLLKIFFIVLLRILIKLFRNH